jgi:hypothetical protein
MNMVNKAQMARMGDTGLPMQRVLWEDESILLKDGGKTRVGERRDEAITRRR